MQFLKFSPDCMPRPPEMMILAPRSAPAGRDFDSSASTKLESPAGAATRHASRSARRRPRAAAGKAVVRTVMTFLLVGDCTVCDRVAGIDRALEGVGARPP